MSMEARAFRAGFLVAVLALVGGAGRPARADLLAVTFDNELIRINTTTGAGTLIGTIPGGNRGPIGLGFRGDQLYTYDQFNDRLVELDPGTGAVRNTINIGAGDLTGEGALDFRSDGIGFLASVAQGLFRFDVAVPGATRIAGVNDFNPTMDGLAFDAADVLYGLSQSGEGLYTVNQATGATTLVGRTGITGFFLVGGLTFDADGTLYAVLSNSAAPSLLYRLNRATGAATLVGNIGFRTVTGLATPPAAIPEPGGIVLFGLGLAGLAAARLRRRRD
jgi:hypothetical protein